MSEEKKQARHRLVADTMAKIKPQTGTDISCNRGGYAILAAKTGARVTAFDTAEDSVAMLYQMAKEKGLAILPLVMDSSTLRRGAVSGLSSSPRRRNASGRI